MMRATAIMKQLDIIPGGAGTQKLRELINFYLAMGNPEEKIPELVASKAEEVRIMQGNTRELRIKNAMEYMWQRYRGKWPVRRKHHRRHSLSGMTSYYYGTLDKMTCPPGWGFIVHNDELVMSYIYGTLGKVSFSHSDMLAVYQKAEPAPAPEVISVPAKPVVAVDPVPEAPAKREGKQTQIKTRPDQLTFAQSVEHNCFDTCVVTGSRMHVRCSAAHLVEHKDGGADYYTNGLWMRWDIHKLFDDGWCAIDPATMTIWFLAEAIALDADLAAYQGKALAPTRKPINTDNLKHRWLAFKTLDKAAE
ncbi:HNH endonuclease [Salmonella enterica subsp. enterica serovar Bareilly]